MRELLERKKGLRRTILIVDDEYIEREMLGAMLSDSYSIMYAKNGALALEMIKRDKLLLSLIILDLHELYGKNYGDHILKKLGSFIHELVQYTGGLACRSDSNCFCLSLPHSDDLDAKLLGYQETPRDRTYPELPLSYRKERHRELRDAQDNRSTHP